MTELNSELNNPFSAETSKSALYCTLDTLLSRSLPPSPPAAANPHGHGLAAVGCPRNQTAVSEGGGDGGGAGALAPPLITTPILNKVSTGSRRKPFRTSSDKRCFSRMSLGLTLPGRYYFLTLSSISTSMPIEKAFKRFRWWFKRTFGDVPFIYIMTSEHCGVLHIVYRLGYSDKNLPVAQIKKYWSSIGGGSVFVKRSGQEHYTRLANYLTDQRKRKKIGNEFAWQPSIIRWRWSKGWIPKGFTRAFGRFWNHWRAAPPGIREGILAQWIKECHKDIERVKHQPRIERVKS